MSTLILTTAGHERFQVVVFLAIFGSIIAFSAYRIIYYLATIRLLEKGYRGISYLPRTSAIVRDLDTWPQARQEEFLVIFQKAPTPHRVDMFEIGGHCDLIKWVSSAATNFIGIEVEVIGSGTCQVFLGVSRDCFVMGGAAQDRANIPTELPLLNTEQIRGKYCSDRADFTQSEMLSFPLSSDCLENLRFDNAEIPIVVVTRSGDYVEYTAAFPTSLGGAITNVYQFLRPTRSFADTAPSSSISIQGIYTSIEQIECMVCYDKPSNTIVLPCRHCCVCTSCIRQLREPKCVVCRRHFNKFLFLPFLEGQTTDTASNPPAAESTVESLN
jgi:hypothetical protein